MALCTNFVFFSFFILKTVKVRITYKQISYTNYNVNIYKVNYKLYLN